MNPIDQAIIEANVRESLEQSGQVGRDKKTVLTYNGDRTGKTVVSDDYFTYVRLHSAVDPETITKASVMTIGGAVEYTADAFTITEIAGTGYSISISGITGILVIPEDCDFAIAGTYAATNCDGAPTTSTEFYTSCIETEIIHPIDPKFLPGVCLPVVELSTVIMVSNHPLTDDESAQLDEVYVKKVPIICNVTVVDYGVSIPLMWINNNTYAANTPLGELSLAKTDSGWIVNMA